MIGSDSAEDLARAMSDLDSGKLNPEPSKTPEPDQKGSSGIMETLRAREKAEEEPEEKKEEERQSTDVIEGYEETDDELRLPVSKQVKDKFARLKGNEKALRKAVEDARKEAAEAAEKAAKLAEEIAGARAAAGEAGAGATPEELKKAIERAEAAEELAGKLDLTKSPGFRRQYDDKVDLIYKDSEPFIAGADDPKALLDSINSALAVASGRENDKKFYDKVGAAIDDSGMRDMTKGQLYNKMIQVRELMNARGEAIEKWKETGNEIARSHEQEVAAKAGDAKLAMQRIRAGYTAANTERIKAYENPVIKEAVDYETLTAPKVAALEKEIEASVRVGAPTPNLIALANDGAELEFQLGLNRTLAKAVAGHYRKVQELTERLSKFEKGGATGGRAPSAASSAPKGEEHVSGIVATMREMESQK